MAKGRESGMPDENRWSEFFNPSCVLAALGGAELDGDVIEFGCGYGTFTEVAARRTRGRVFAIDIEPEMVECTRRRLNQAGLANAEVSLRDFMDAGCGRPDESAAFVLLFNILHIDRPTELLNEAYRVLRPGGKAAVVHWICDPSTPRGPSMEIRPTPEKCAAWGTAVGFQIDRLETLECCPYHYGLVLSRPFAKV